jgi:prevent-host-death family protein
VNVNIHEAKTHLSRLIERVCLGEEVTIMKAGKAVARLVPVENAPTFRELGWAMGEFAVPDDFDAPLPADWQDAFYR